MWVWPFRIFVNRVIVFMAKSDGGPAMVGPLQHWNLWEPARLFAAMC